MIQTITYDDTLYQLVPIKPDWNMEMFGIKEMERCTEGELECIGEKALDSLRADVSRIFQAMLSAAPTPPAQPEQHADDAAVDRFAAAMKEKLADARAKGRGGWEICPMESLQEMLVRHVVKGDPRDVANFCMMLWNRGERTTIEHQWVYDLFGAWPAIGEQPAHPAERKPLEWMPIETAPKESSEQIILGFAPDEDGYTLPSREGFWNPVFGVWVVSIDPDWLAHGQPTHWMPLPPPPENGITGES